MTIIDPSDATKKLLLQHIVETIEYHKKSLYLQEIINMGKANTIWHKALTEFFKDPMNSPSLKSICKN